MAAYRDGKFNETRRKAAADLRRRAVDHLGGECQRCGNGDYRVLEIDHTDGGGHSERKHVLREVFWKQILAGRSDVQLLCANCHRIKTYFE